MRAAGQPSALETTERRSPDQLLPRLRLAGELPAKNDAIRMNTVIGLIATIHIAESSTSTLTPKTVDGRTPFDTFPHAADAVISPATPSVWLGPDRAIHSEACRAPVR